MTWKKTGDILIKRLNQRGLGGMVQAGVLCQEAEALLPGVFRAVSVRNAILHLEISPSNLLAFKMQEGRLLSELNSIALQKRLDPIKGIRLTAPRP